MLSFLQFLNEAFEIPDWNRIKDDGPAQTQVYDNPSMSRLKSLAKNNRYNTARFTIDKDDRLKAGDSFHHTHQSIEPAYGHVAIRGLVIHDEGKYHYRTMGKYDNHPQEHPLLSRLEKHGITNGNNNPEPIHESVGWGVNLSSRARETLRYK